MSETSDQGPDSQSSTAEPGAGGLPAFTEDVEGAGVEGAGTDGGAQDGSARNEPSEADVEAEDGTGTGDGEFPTGALPDAGGTGS